jgi:hypothetical protein
MRCEARAVDNRSMGVNVTEVLTADVDGAAADAGGDVQARTRLEELLGRDLTRMLLTALSSGQARRGGSSP